MSREKENIEKEGKFLDIVGEKGYRGRRKISWEKEDIVRESKCLERRKIS
jgi:hypothetical protein